MLIGQVTRERELSQQGEEREKKELKKKKILLVVARNSVSLVVAR